MKKVKSLKGMIIAVLNDKEAAEKNHKYEVFTPDEWVCGEGYRYPEVDTDSIKEAEEFILSY